MSKPTVTIYDVLTGESETRDMNDAEFAQYQIDQEQLQLQKKLDAETVKAKQAILDRLGITADEAALLLK
jgi:NAD-dependent oxidoreductase involved in siderophore biosynthesis